jgi:hypothetical protein
VPEGIKHNKWSKIMKKIKQELQNRINDTIAKNTTKGHENLWGMFRYRIYKVSCAAPLILRL